MNAIIKSPKPSKPFDVDAHILAQWLLFCKTPRKAEPDLDGMFSLGEIGDTRGKTWKRPNGPYSLAKPVR